jgi:hypothetical protein
MAGVVSVTSTARGSSSASRLPPGANGSGFARSRPARRRRGRPSLLDDPLVPRLLSAAVGRRFVRSPF